MGKWQQDLENLKLDPSSWQGLRPHAKTVLINKGLVDAQGNVIVPEKWRVEFFEKADAGNWHTLHSPMGEKMEYDSRDYAEMQARKLSVLNNRQYRVIQGKATTFIVYDDGQAFVHQAVNGVIVRNDIASQPFDDDDYGEGEDIDTYRLQSRTIHTFNSGRFATWGWEGQREYADFATAKADVLKLSKANLRSEFRIVTVMGLQPTDAIVYQGGAPAPDVQRLDDLVNVCQEDDSEARALVRILELWRGPEAAHEIIHTMLLEVQHD